MKSIDKTSSSEAVQAAFRHAEQLELQGQFVPARAIYQQIAKSKPGWPYAHYGIGSTYFGVGKFEEARRNIRKAISLKADHAAFHAKMAEILNRLDDSEQAIESVDKAIELDPSNSDHVVTKASIFRYNGYLPQAYNLLLPIVESGEGSDLLQRIFASLCGAIGDPERGIEALAPVAEKVNKDKMVTATHCFVLTKLYDQTEQYDKAYESATRGSELRGDRYPPEERTQLFEDRARVWSKDRLTEMPRSRSNTTKPVFIVGMPRSGTTLIEQIIAAHPKAYGCGELINILEAATEIATANEQIPQLVSVIENLKSASLDRVARRILKDMEKQAPKGEKPERITDKMPLNFQHLGLIEILFPNAKIIHCTRHVLDNFISCYLLDFAGLNNQAYTYHPKHFAHFYSLYLKYMEHWKSVCSIPILDVSYEDTIADQRAMTERILDFLQLEWDDACMSFFEAKRAVNTASVEQVRKQIYTSSQARWKNYEAHLDPVREALEEYGVEYNG